MGKHSKHRVSIRRPRAGDCAAFLAAVERSCLLHQPWVSPPSSRKAFSAYLARLSSKSHHGYLVIHRESGDLVGVINVSHIIRGPLESAFLGYYSFSPYARQGLMCEGMRLVLQEAFHTLKLHRVEANIQPANQASIALVRKCGFVREGFSRRYLKLAGRWRDHERWALLSEDFK